MLSRLGRSLFRHYRTTSSLLLLGTTAVQSQTSHHCLAFGTACPSVTILCQSPNGSVRSMSSSSRSENRAGLLATSSTSSEADGITHVDVNDLPDWLRPERTRILTKDVALPKTGGKSVVYWMQRDVRTVDNWALLYATYMAQRTNAPLHVLYVVPPSVQDDVDDSLPPTMISQPMTDRYGSFLLGGLEKVHKELTEDHNVPFHIVTPSSSESVGEDVCRQVIDKCQPNLVVCDFSPLRQYRHWIEHETVPLLMERQIPLVQVDAHNVVPVWHASNKLEVGARTLRPKIHKLVSKFLTSFPKFEGNAHLDEKAKVSLMSSTTKFQRKELEEYLCLDKSVPPVDWAQPGTDAGMARFRSFCTGGGLKNFDSLRNNPTRTDVCSNLSPWINYGHVSFQRLAMQVKALNRYANGTASFIEEGLVRRELSDNFCFYAPDNYDSLESAAQWAQDSLEVHSSDPREYLYSLQELEKGETHDDLWNAAEMQLLQEGKMHGFLRMYWAKKILEWTESPLVALRTAQYLNDRYSLDGNDPNGFVGVGWSIMGIHDMGWKERPVFGKIRYMNYAGCMRKFKVAEFVARYPAAADNALKLENKMDGKSPKTTKKKAAGTKRKRRSG